MKTPLRIKFMKWLTFQTLLVFAAIAVIVYAFNLRERGEHPEMAQKEAEEFFIVLGLMGLSLPFVLFSAWGVSKQLLRPLQGIIRSAALIQSGKLDHRVEPEVEHDEIGQLARTINGAFDSYQHALQRIDRFSFAAAHQLRNPLAAIRTTGEVCLQQPRTPQEYQDAIGKMLEDSGRLSHTVNQLLTLARLGRRELSGTFEEVDLAKLVREVLDVFAPVFEDKQISVEKSLAAEPIMIRGLPNLLREALVNLLDNAVRFVPQKGRIAVQLRALPTGQIELTVEDDGPGIPAVFRDNIFDQSKGNGEPRSEGTGLGLAITADVIRAHQGAIKVSSSDRGGAKFTIQFGADRQRER